MKNLYGLSEQEFMQLARGQRWKCALCDKRKRLCVDHCHKTGEVRMLLCLTCNLGIGYLKDSAALCEKAAMLLRRKA